MLDVSCPQCSNRLRAPDEFIGKKVKCGSCGEIFVADDSRYDYAVATPPVPGSNRAKADEAKRVPPHGRHGLDSWLPFFAIAMSIAVVVLMIALIVVIMNKGSSGGDKSSTSAELRTIESRLSKLEVDAARLKTPIQQPQPPIAEAKPEKRETVAEPDPPQTVLPPQTTVKDELVREWGLENAVFEVKVLKISQTASYAKLAIQVTNKSKAFISFWNVSASIYNRGETFLANSSTNSQNLRPGETTMAEISFADTKSAEIARWTLRLERISLQNENGNRLFHADKYFTLHENTDTPPVGANKSAD